MQKRDIRLVLILGTSDYRKITGTFGITMSFCQCNAFIKESQNDVFPNIISLRSSRLQRRLIIGQMGRQVFSIQLMRSVFLRATTVFHKNIKRDYRKKRT